MKQFLFLSIILTSLLISGAAFGDEFEEGNMFTFSGDGYRFKSGVGTEDDSGDMYGIYGKTEMGEVVASFSLASIKNAAPEFQQCVEDGKYKGAIEITAKIYSISRIGNFEFEIDNSAICKQR
jgi:hypothetical protein